jgi:hypothetical protein
MRLTVLLLMLTVLVAALGVRWVSQRSPLEAEPPSSAAAPTQVQAEAERIAARRGELQRQMEEIRRERQRAALAKRAYGTPSPSTPAQAAAYAKQMKAEHIRSELGLVGCFSTPTSCKCLDAAMQKIPMPDATCRLVAAERPRYYQ